MGLTNINYETDMTKSFLDGETDSMSYYLDFPFEVEKRYRKKLTPRFSMVENRG